MSWLEETDTAVMAESETNEFGAVASGLYKAKIMVASITEARESEAKALYLNFELENGQFFTTTLWFKNKQGSSFYVDKKSGKNRYLPSFITMQYIFDALGLKASECQPTTMTMNIYGEDKELPTFKELLGKTVEIGIQKVLIDKYNDETVSDEDNELIYTGTVDGKSGKEVRDNATALKDRASAERRLAKTPEKDKRKMSKEGYVPEATATAEEASAVGGW